MGNALFSIRDDLSFASEGYQVDQDTGVWVNRPHSRLSLPVEDVARSLRGLNDRGVWSREFADLLHEEPFASQVGIGQHLGLTPLTLDTLSSVLCLGRGLANVTRWFAESGLSVAAVSDDIEDAAITAARCLDQSRVTVIAGSPQDVRTSEPHELGVVSCIGSGRGAEHAFQMIDSITQCISETATVVIMADNPAYTLWAGRASQEPSTVSLDAWNELLRSNGFAQVEWWACYPSPALPLSMIQEKAFLSNPDLVRGLVRYGLSHSLGGLQPLPQELTPLVERGVGIRVAPGWIGIAHRHRVHRILHRGEIAHRFVLDANASEIVREDWRPGGEIAQPSHRSCVASPNREVVLALSEALPTFRTTFVVQHELGQVTAQLRLAKEELRILVAQNAVREQSLRKQLQEERATSDILRTRIESLVRTEERTIRMLAASKEEIQYLEAQCVRLERRRDELMELTAAMSSSIKILSQPRKEPSIMGRIKRAAELILAGTY